MDKILDVKDLLKLFAAEHGHHIRHQDGGDGQEQPAVRPGLRPAAPLSPAGPVSRIQGTQAAHSNRARYDFKLYSCFLFILLI